MKLKIPEYLDVNSSNFLYSIVTTLDGEVLKIDENASITISYIKSTKAELGTVVVSGNIYPPSFSSTNSIGTNDAPFFRAYFGEVISDTLVPYSLPSDGVVSGSSLGISDKRYETLYCKDIDAINIDGLLETLYSNNRVGALYILSATFTNTSSATGVSDSLRHGDDLYVGGYLRETNARCDALYEGGSAAPSGKYKVLSSHILSLSPSASTSIDNIVCIRVSLT